MKIKINSKKLLFGIVLLANLQSHVQATEMETLVQTKKYPTIVKITYLPIIQYQQMLQDMIRQLLASYIYQQKFQEKIEHKIAAQAEEIATEIHSSIPTISRNDALLMIQDLTSKIFDPRDEMHISIYLKDMKKIARHLDPITDKKTIDAIQFLIENQDKSSFTHIPFWIRQIKEKELKTAIPVNAQIAKMADVDKLRILQKKMTLPIS